MVEVKFARSDVVTRQLQRYLIFSFVIVRLVSPVYDPGEGLYTLRYEGELVDRTGEQLCRKTHL